MVGWLFALLSYHSWVLFSSLTVTYVLYLNIFGKYFCFGIARKKRLFSWTMLVMGSQEGKKADMFS